jgi:hypothetical protein
MLAAIFAAQVVLGFTVGLLLPWFGIFALHIDDMQKLLMWSVGILLPVGALIDGILFAGAGFLAWRKWIK